MKRGLLERALEWSRQIEELEKRLALVKSARVFRLSFDDQPWHAMAVDSTGKGLDSVWIEKLRQKPGSELYIAEQFRQLILTNYEQEIEQLQSWLAKLGNDPKDTEKYEWYDPDDQDENFSQILAETAEAEK